MEVQFHWQGSWQIVCIAIYCLSDFYSILHIAVLDDFVRSAWTRNNAWIELEATLFFAVSRRSGYTLFVM